ncbi:MAG: hypothetical protein V3T82_07925 [Nitrospinaceae bacterium]
MPKQTPIQNTYGGGEWTPDLEGRTDLEGWYNSLRIMKNWIAQVFGSAARRPGTIFISSTKADGVARLIPFVFNKIQTYQLEFGDEYIRFFTLRGVLESAPDVPLEIVSPFGVDDIASIKFTQSNDVLFLFTGTFQVRKLIRQGPLTWVIEEIKWIDGPYLDENGDDSFTLTPSGTTGAITVVASADLFLVTDIGRIIRIGFLGTDWAASTAYVVDDLRVANENVYRCKIAGTSGTTGGPSGTGLGIPDGTCAWDFVNTGGIGWGYVEITAFTDEQNVNATVIASLVNSGVATAVWRMGLFSDTTGFPVHGAFQDSRLFLGGAAISNPNMIAGSKVGDFENHSPSVADDGPILKPIDTDEQNAIQWLASGKGLQVGTQGAEVVMARDRQFGTITPTNNVINVETSEGCASIQPVKVQKGLLFVQFHLKRLQEFIYTFTEDGWESPDMTLRADHITDDGAADGIVSMARQRQPWSVIWSARADGVLLGLSYMRKEAVVAWHRHELGGDNGGNGFGKVLSVSTIPGANNDELWMIVERVIDGNTVRYVELLADPLRKGGNRETAVYLDSSLTGFDATPQDTWSGLDHLEGETVKVLADGAAHKDVTVDGGEVTLDREVNNVVFGFEIDSVILPQRTDAGSAQGTAQGKQKMVDNITIGVKDSLGMQYGRTLDKLFDVNSRTASDLMDEAPPLETGSRQLAFPGGWDKDADVYLVNRSAFPTTLTYHVLNVITGDGK